MSKYAGNIVTTGADAGYSVYFDGTGDYLSVADNTALDMGASDFTIECYVYITATPGTAFLFGKRANNATYGALLIQYSGNTTPILLATVNGSSWGVNITSTITTPLNTWAHVAVTRSGNTWTIWINGVSGGTTTVSGTVPDNASAFTVGAGSADGGNPMPSCYIANFRVIKGTALYTAAFTPPTQLLNITNTSLLTCNSPAIVDQSSNNFTITANGDAKVNTFTPFAGYQGFNPALGAAANGVWKLSDASYYQGTRTWPIYDPYFRQTTLLLHGNSPTNVPTWITDVSTNNFAVTVTGDARAANLSPFSLTTYPNSGSGYFDGNGDYLTLPSNTAFNIFGGDMTMECWFYQTSTTNTSQHLFAFVETGTNRESLYFNGTTLTFWTSSGAGSGPRITYAAPTLNTWHHVAVVKSGSTFTMYVDGVSAGTSTTTQYSTANQLMRIGTYDGTFTPDYFTGYIANVRVVKGVAVYTGNFTVPTAPLGATQSAGTNISAITGTSTSLLTLQNSQSSNNNSFLDSSTNNFLITRAGNTTQGTFTPFSQTGWSNYFAGGNGSLVSLASAPLPATGAFNFECWVYSGVSATDQVIYSQYSSANSNRWTISINSSNKAAMGGNSLATLSTVSTLNTNTWYHIAISRDASNVGRIFLNGVLEATNSSWTGTLQTDNPRISGFDNPSQLCFNGYISNMRIMNVAYYTASFTPPTSPLTAIAGTTFLGLQNSRLVDNSASNIALTPTATSIQAFSPFVPTYTTPVTYSNWFDGNGDYISAAANTAFTFGSGAFTVEGWIYPTAVAATYQYIASVWGIVGQSDATYSSWVLRLNTSNLQVVLQDNASGALVTITQSTGSVSANAWSHVAVVRNSNTVTLYLNGVAVGSGTFSATLNNPSSAFVAGLQLSNNNQFTGLISNLRIVKGTAIYTAAFTPPTGPLTAVSGTSLLTCQSSTFVDNSTNNFTISSFGNVRPVASPNPFGFNVDQTTLNGAYSASLNGGSGYFDGTGDSIAFPTSQASLLPGAGAFTYEVWCYQTVLTSNATVFSYGNATGNLRFFVANATSVTLWNGATNLINQSTTNPLNSWQHFIVQRDGSNVVSIYQNGVRIYNNTVASTFNAGTLTLGNDAGGTAWNGYISGFKATIGSALYSGTGVAIPTAPPSPSGSTACVLFTNGGIIDSTGKIDLETVADAKISTAQSKWGGSSMYFDGTGDYLYLPSNQNLVLGTADFTLECWIYATSTPSDMGIFESRTNGTATTADGFTLTAFSGSVIRIFSNGALISSSGTSYVNTWCHVAVTRLSGTFNLYINGVSQGTNTTARTFSNADAIIGGGRYGTGAGVTTYFPGYIEDFRITKGYARYTGNFTPPTSQFQDQ